MLEENILKKVLDRNVKIYVIATGAGAGIQKKLWDVPGCSSYFVGGEFPYKTEKTSALLGFTPERFVSEETSIELAMKAYMEAYDPNESPDDVIGIGLTASVASLKAHRGDHRVFVTVISNKVAFSYNVTLLKGEGEQAREIDGNICDELAKKILLESLGLSSAENATSVDYSRYITEFTVVPHSNEKLIDLIMKRPYLKADGTRGIYVRPEMPVVYHGGLQGPPTVPNKRVIFNPGSFNPLHFGHIEAAEAARNSRINDCCYDVELIYCTCINPVHKPHAKATDLLQRISQMRGRNFLLTKDDALFLDKARAYPNAGFVLGADALLTMLNPKWYKDPSDIEKMLEELNDLNVKFYIVGRLVDGQFVTLKDIQQKHPNIINYCFLFCSVQGRWDISSTELRNKTNGM